MTTLVFGGTGLIGSAIVEALPGDAMVADREVDVCHAPAVGHELCVVAPTAVVNATWPRGAGEHIRGFETVMREALSFWQSRATPGCLINIASVYATLPPRFELYPDGMDKDPDYVAAKAAIVQLTKYWARKVRGSGIRVNAVSPGGVYRDEPRDFVKAYAAQTNHGRMLPAEAVAQACRFLVECEYCTGQNLVIADGFDL